MSQIKLSKNFIKNTVKLALNEDLFPTGDITSNLIKNDKIIKVNLISNQNAIVGGLKFAKEAFNLVDDKIRFETKKKDGSFVKKNSLIAIINENRIKNKSFRPFDTWTSKSTKLTKGEVWELVK